ncbi:MAG: hypothetical protein F6K22_23495 [Okeania sp. SIO2F4]|uniref:hypothetical protein n=1 Tax=Okeania sp. SIO2F4 TaxID=2607790 RepID=UPI00142A9323|nr:hypothetical protein [Okeania sp. SIO2F4]NES05515.1 hypothetical protein [Okeania sp. SIO2F4]
MTNKIFRKCTVAIASTTLLAIVSQTPVHAASFNFNFPLIDNLDNILGSGSVSFEAEPDNSVDVEKFAVNEFDVNLTLTDSLETFSFTKTGLTNAVFFNGEFSGIEYQGQSQESENYVLLIDGGDEAVKSGEPGAWSLWSRNLDTGGFEKFTEGDNVSYKSVREPNSLVGLGIFGLSLLVTQKKNKFQSNIKF